MEAGQMVLLKMRGSPFAGTKILGVLQSIDDSKIQVRECCVIHDLIQQTRDGAISIRPTYFVTSIEAEGSWTYYIKEDITAIRQVAENEDILKIYDDTYARYKAEKAGLTLPQNIRPQPPVQGAQ